MQHFFNSKRYIIRGVLLMFVTLFMVAPSASATVFTTTIADSYWCPYYATLGTTVPSACDTVEVTLTTDKSTYLPGETVTVTGAMRLLNTKSGSTNLLTYYLPGFTWELVYHRYYISATVNGVTKDLFNYPYGSSAPATAPFTCSKTGSLGLPLCLPSGTATFTAPAVNGNYNATCSAFIGQTFNQVDDRFTATIPPATCKVSFTVASPLPNLTFAPINETTAVAGQSKVFTSLLSNIGTASTTSPFYSYLQRATAYNAVTRVATGVTDVNQKGVAVILGPSRPTTTLSFLSYVVPVEDARTTKYFRACADNTSSVGTNQAITESNENDNCGDWTAVQITATEQANIIALSTTPSNAAPLAGAAVTFAAQVRNTGTILASNVPNGFQLAFNAGKTAPYTWIAATQVATLAVPNGVANITSSNSFSTNTVGTYYVRACGNHTVSGNPPSGTLNTAISESSTTDNCDTAWVPVTVTLSPDAGKPNLRVFERLTPQTGTVGLATTYSVPVYNTSTDTDVTASFSAVIQKTNDIDGSGNPTGDVFDDNVAVITTDVFKSGSATLSVPIRSNTWVAGDAGMTRHLRICADKSSAADLDGSITESNTEDNCGEWTPIAVSGAPTGVLTLDSSCIIASGASSCPVAASWTTTYATNAYVWDQRASLTRYTGNNGSGNVTLNLPATTFTFDLKNGDGTVLSTKSATASCVGGTVYSGGICLAAPPVVLIPTAYIDANPKRVPKGSNTNVTWNGTNSTSCTLRKYVGNVEEVTGGWPMTSIQASNTTQVPVSAQTEFRLKCTNGVDISAEQKVVVNIFPDFTEF